VERDDQLHALWIRRAEFSTAKSKSKINKGREIKWHLEIQQCPAIPTSA
jgi:hypothetical protein